jgi:ATP-dependent Clp protease ATP-binding subunit ClpB
VEKLALNTETKHAIRIAQSIAKEYSNANFSGSHLLRAILHKDFSLRSYLEKAKKDFYFMEDWADVRIEAYPKSTKVEEPTGDEKIKAVFDEAENTRIKLSKDEIDLLSILGALCTPGIAFSYDQLKTLPITVSELLSENIEQQALETAIGGSTARNHSTTVLTALSKFCIDKTAMAREGKLDPVVARDRELRMTAEILGRRSRPNVIITGGPGVGKTSLVNGFVFNVLADRVPANLANTLIFELDASSFIAGASYKGEAEDRMKSVIGDIQQFDKAILYIDNIHSLIDKNGSTPGIVNVLKPQLSRGQLTIIGTTTNENYRKHIESDESFSRLFEVVKLEEPDEIAAARMINVIVPYFERHHNLKIGEGVVTESIRLARRYLNERSLPDSAIDLIDRTMSALKFMEQTSEKDIEALRAELSALFTSKNNLHEDQRLNELRWMHGLIKNKISPTLFASVGEEGTINDGINGEELFDAMNSMLDKLLEAALIKRESVEKSDIASVVAGKTGIPVGKLQAGEKERLMNMENFLKRRVVGQDHAIKSVCEAILESRSGLSKAGQPVGSFFFLGPTGTGKTELAKSLAEFLFGDETALIRFDMSEFKEEHSAALLYGAPPGYVGYEEGGLLVNKIRLHPYAVVLFDEIEKAHPAVFDLFLQIMDEGKLHDRLGKEGDFSNAVILFTSNIGSEFIAESFKKNVIPASADLMEIMTRHFRPEFLARLTEITPFSPITEEIVVNIFSIHLKGLLGMLEKQGITLTVSDGAKEYLAKLGFTPRYGARPVQGVIRTQIRRPLSRMIISGELQRGDHIGLELGDDDKTKWVKYNKELAIAQ